MDNLTSRQAVSLALNISRRMLASQLGQQTAFRGARQYYDALGYRKSIDIDDYVQRYERQDIARRIVDAPADDTWGKPPQISEDGDTDTPFCEAWQALVDRTHVWNRLTRADRLSRVGQFGILLLGLRAGESLAEPVEDGSLNGVDDVLYLTPYRQDNVVIKATVEDVQNERYGLPEMYEVQVTDENKEMVHWTRILHLAEDRASSEVYGIPPLKAAFNRLDDLIKTVGGSAEATWMNMRKGTILGVKEGYDPNSIDEQDIEDELENYAHDLLRILWLQGVEPQEFGGAEVVDPRGNFDVIIAILAAVTGIPQRVLLGSAQGELSAAREDTRQWAMHIAGRQKTYAEPDILRPFIDRLMVFGALPEVEAYNIGTLGQDGEWHWPPITQMTEEEQAQILANQSQAIRALSDPMANYPIDEAERREFLGWPAERPMTLSVHSHNAQVVNRECPLCHSMEALKYDGHKGLLVCRGCGKTYDPEVE